MPAVIAVPELMTSAPTDLATIVSNLSAAHAVAAAPTVAVQSAAADKVSTAVAHVFSQHARDYQALAGQATAFQEQFAQHLAASSGTYAGAEAANVALLQPLDAVAGSINSALGGLPSQAANVFNSVQSQVLNLINTVQGQLLNVALAALSVFVVILVVLIVLAVITLNTLAPEAPA